MASLFCTPVLAVGPIQSVPCQDRFAARLHGELAELVSHHVFGDGYGVVDLAVVHLKVEADETRQDGGGAGLCADWWEGLALLRPNEGKAVTWNNISYC